MSGAGVDERDKGPSDPGLGGAVSRHVYPSAAVAGDYGRAALGIALTWGPLAVVEPAVAVGYALGGLGALFAAFGLRTALRHASRIELSPEGIAIAGPLATRLPWDRITGLSLRYYSTQRDRRGGWMQLRLRRRGRALVVDSTIEGFVAIVRAAAEAAARNGVELGAATRTNLSALGIEPPEPRR